MKSTKPRKRYASLPLKILTAALVALVAIKAFHVAISSFRVQSANPEIDSVFDPGCKLCEGPIWDELTQTLHLVDILGKKIHSYSILTKNISTIEMREQVGAVALTDDPNLLIVATERSVKLVNISGTGPGTQKILAVTPEAHGAGECRFNDAKVSPSGVLLLGRVDGWNRHAQARLYALGGRFGTTLTEIIKPGEVLFPNGMDWLGDEFYFADSVNETVTAYKTDADGVPLRNDDGNLKGRVVAAMHSSPPTHPDGLTFDNHGNMWLVLADSSSVVCLSTTTGKVLRLVRLPLRRPTSCIFGGPNLDELYVTAFAAEEAGQPEGVYRIKGLGVRGVGPTNKFKFKQGAAVCMHSHVC